MRRQQQSFFDVRVFDRSGRILFDSNLALFEALTDRYQERDSSLFQQPGVSEPLEHLIPRDGQLVVPPRLRGYWRYLTKDDHAAHVPVLPASLREPRVAVVKPARRGMREFHFHSNRAIRQLATIMARSLSRFVASQLPDLPGLQGFGAQDDRSAAWLA